MDNLRILIDKETGAGYRVIYLLSSNKSTIQDVVADYKDKENVVQFVDAKTGETIKGPLYDTTDQKIISGQYIEQHLNRGVKQQKPIEPTQHEPIDKINEISTNFHNYKAIDVRIDVSKSEIWILVNNSSNTPNYHGVNVKLDFAGHFIQFVVNKDDILANQQTVSDARQIIDVATKAFKKIMDEVKKFKPMNEITKFRKIVKECINEFNREKDPRARLKESLRGVVRNVLKEIAVNVPTKFDKDETETIQKQYNKKGNERLDKTNDKQQKELETIVHGIDPTWDCYWDDHNQLIVRAQNLLYVRVCQRFENSYDVDAMVKLVDRVRAIALTWEQVKSFVKANFGDLKNETKADSLKKKALDQIKDRDVIKKAAGPNHDIIKNRGEKSNGEDAKIKSTKKADKNYNEPLTKRDEDMPDQPMKQVTEPGKDPEGKNKNIKKTEKVAAPKHKNDKKLRLGDKKTTKFKEKKSD